MDLCRTIIIAALACALLQAGERLSYSAADGLRLTAAAAASGRA